MDDLARAEVTREALASLVQRYLADRPLELAALVAWLGAHPELLTETASTALRTHANVEFEEIPRRALHVLAEFVHHASHIGLEAMAALDHEQLIEYCFSDVERWEDVAERVARVGAYRAYTAVHYLMHDAQRSCIGLAGPVSWMFLYTKVAMSLGPEAALDALDLHGDIAASVERAEHRRAGHGTEAPIFLNAAVVEIGNHFGGGFDEPHDATECFRRLYESVLHPQEDAEDDASAEAVSAICIAKLLRRWTHHPFGAGGNLGTAIALLKDAQRYFDALSHPDHFVRLELDIAEAYEALAPSARAEASLPITPRALAALASAARARAAAIALGGEDVSLIADVQRAASGLGGPAPEDRDTRQQQLHHAMAYIDLGRTPITRQQFCRRINATRLAQTPAHRQRLMAHNAVLTLWRWDTFVCPTAELDRRRAQMCAFAVIHLIDLELVTSPAMSERLARYASEADRVLPRYLEHPFTRHLWVRCKRRLAQAAFRAPAAGFDDLIRAREHLQDVHRALHALGLPRDPHLTLDEATLLLVFAQTGTFEAHELLHAVERLLNEDRTDWSEPETAHLFHCTGSIIALQLDTTHEHNVSVAIELLESAFATFSSEQGRGDYWTTAVNLAACLKRRGAETDGPRIRELWHQCLHIDPHTPPPDEAATVLQLTALQSGGAHDEERARLELALLHRLSDQRIASGNVAEILRVEMMIARKLAARGDWTRVDAQLSIPLDLARAACGQSRTLDQYAMFNHLADIASLKAYALCRLDQGPAAWQTLEAARFISAASVVALTSPRIGKPEREAFRAALLNKLRHQHAIGVDLLDPTVERPPREAFEEQEVVFKRILAATQSDLDASLSGASLNPPRSVALCYVVIEEAGAYSLLVHRGRDDFIVDVHPITLTSETVGHFMAGADTGWLQVYVDTFRSAGHTLTREHDAERPGTPCPTHARWNRTVEAFQQGLGGTVMNGIHEQLLRCGVSPQTHVFLQMPGALSGLPFLAVPVGRSTESPRTFLQAWSSSIVPSGAIAKRCTEQLEADSFHDSVLLVHSPSNGHAALPGFDAEQALLDRLSGDRDITVLSGDAASLERVEQHASGRGYLHFACHAQVDVTNVLTGLLLAHDEVLYPTEISTRLSLTGARLVYLSACEAGLANLREARNESLGLPSHLLAAGASAVIGTLWPVFDDTAVIASRLFYERHLGEGQGVTESFRAAIQRLREITFAELAQMYPRLDTATGAFLQLGTTAHLGDARARAFGRAEPDAEAARGLTLRLGAGDERPFAHPAEWAGFCLFGI